MELWLLWELPWHLMLLLVVVELLMLPLNLLLSLMRNLSVLNNT